MRFQTTGRANGITARSNALQYGSSRKNDQIKRAKIHLRYKPPQKSKSDRKSIYVLFFVWICSVAQLSNKNMQILLLMNN